MEEHAHISDIWHKDNEKNGFLSKSGAILSYFYHHHGFLTVLNAFKPSLAMKRLSLYGFKAPIL